MTEQLKPGDLVRIRGDRMELLAGTPKELIGKVCEVKWMGRTHVNVYAPDKSDYWYYPLDAVEKVEQYGASLANIAEWTGAVGTVDATAYYANKAPQLIPTNPLLTKSMNLIKRITQSTETKALIHFNIINECGDLTPNGQQQLLQALFDGITIADFKKTLVAEYEKKQENK